MQFCLDRYKMNDSQITLVLGSLIRIVKEKNQLNNCWNAIPLRCICRTCELSCLAVLAACRCQFSVHFLHCFLLPPLFSSSSSSSFFSIFFSSSFFLPRIPPLLYVPSSSPFSSRLSCIPVTVCGLTGAYWCGQRPIWMVSIRQQSFAFATTHQISLLWSSYQNVACTMVPMYMQPEEHELPG